MATSPKAAAKSRSKKPDHKPVAKKAVPGESSPKKKAVAKAAKSKTRSRKSVPSKTSAQTTAKKATTSKKRAAAKKVATKKATAKKAAATKTATTKKVATKTATAKKAAATKTATAKKAAATKKATAKKAAAKKATAKKVVKSKLPKKFIEQMKVRLLDERSKYLQTAEDYRAEADSLFDDREPGDVQFDEESGEGDTLAVERERGLALSTQARSAVQQIDEALARIEAGTYGICVVSSEPIPKERLEAIPWAAMTVQHKVGGFARR